MVASGVPASELHIRLKRVSVALVPIYRKGLSLNLYLRYEANTLKNLL